MPAPHHSVFYRPDALPAAKPTVSKQIRCMHINACCSKSLEKNSTRGSACFFHFAKQRRHITLNSVNSGSGQYDLQSTLPAKFHLDWCSCAGSGPSVCLCMCMYLYAHQSAEICRCFVQVMFEPYLKNFYIRSNDSTHVKLLKVCVKLINWILCQF